jgi:hypothetical protein
MTSAPTTLTVIPEADDHQPFRLRLKSRVPVTGRVDGGWWPRSRDLPAEVPGLLAALTTRLGDVESVSYNLGDWETAPRKIVLDGRLVRLAGYRSQHPGTVDVLDARHLVTLLVVPPGTATPAAQAILTAAGRDGSTDEVEALLLTAGPPSRS